MKPINVYSASWNLSIATLDSATSSFIIPAQGRTFKLRSVLIDWVVYRNGVIFPWRNNSDQLLTVQIGGWPEKIALPFQVTAGNIPASNGQYLILSEPGQKFFNSFFATNSLPFYFTITNFNAAARDHTFSITAEVQDI